jgi:hypothetical protein
MLGHTLGAVPSVAWGAARRITKDITGKNAQVSAQALKFVGYHAAAGAAVGGGYAAANGGDFGRGVMMGGLGGAAFGVGGGLPMINQAVRAGAFRSNQLQALGGAAGVKRMQRFNVIASNAKSTATRQRAMNAANEMSRDAFNQGSRARTRADLGRFGAYSKAMDHLGYNPFG